MTKNSLLTIGGVSLLGIGLISGLALTTSAQEVDTSNPSTDASQIENAGRRFARRRGASQEVKDAKEAVRTAIDNQDYEAWRAAAAELPNSEHLLSQVDTQEKFDRLLEAHSLKEEARAIMEELGLDRETLRQQKQTQRDSEDNQS
jgi:uncharacterized membrane protein